MPENKVDYTGIQIPDIESIRKTSKQFEDWRKSMGFKTQEEKIQAIYQKAKEDQANIPEDMNSEDVYMWYNNFQHDPKKQAEFRQQGAQGAGLLMTVPMTIASAGTMGWVPALTTTATGMAGGYGGYKAGEYLDKKLDTNWIAPTLGFVGGMVGGSAGYKGLVRAGSNGLLKGKGNLYGKSFMGDVMADMAKSTEIATPSYGKVKYYGPTMGKTTAAKTNTNLVDFDDYVRPELEQLASELGITRQQLMMSQDPTIREKTRRLMLKSIDGWKKNSGNDGKTLVISKSDILQDPIFDNQPLVLQRDEFLKRNAARGETDLQNSMDWYASTRRKGRDKLMEWPDSEGVYISELEPFVLDPHTITFTPTQSVQGNTSYKFFERPSTYFKDARYPVKSKTYGSKEVPAWQLPKGQRNQPISVRTPSQEYSNRHISAKMNPRKPMWEYEDMTENYLRDNSANELNKRLKEYVSYARHKGSSQYIDDHIVRGYRNYLHHLDFDAKDLSDDELRIILSKHFADITKSASGKMRDQIVWHSSPTWFDEFDYRYTGKNMENSGAMGPGNYFSKEATMYGRGKRNEFSGKYDMGNTQPYVITDVMSTPSGKDMQDKGLLPTIIQKYRGRDKFGNKWDPDPEFDVKLKTQIDAVPSNDNKMYVLKGTDSGFDKLYQGPFGVPSGELMIRRNTGIKSLYPHPSRFVRDEDGFVHLIPTNWNDPRVNFEKGGKINPQQ